MPVHAFYLLSRQQKPCGEHTSQVCVPHGGAVEITAGPSSEAEGPCRKRRGKKGERILFHQVVGLQRFCPGSDTGTISSCWYRGGRICPLAWVYLLFTDHYIGIEKKQVKVADLRCKCDFHCGCVLQHRLAFGDLARFDDSCSHGKERRRENRDDRR